MKTPCRWLGLRLVALGLTLASAAGCQTYVMEAGLTLPTGWYLRQQPQFIPPTPEYPLPRELSNLELAAQQERLGPPGPLLPGAGPKGP
jgi:hypothetical protein